MFRVTIQEYSNEGKGRTMDLIINTEKFQQLLGRYTLKINPPDLLISEEGITEYEFFKQVADKKYIAALVSFAQVSKSEDNKKHTSKVSHIDRKVSYNIPPPLPPAEPDEDRLLVMAKSGAFKKSTF